MNFRKKVAWRESVIVNLLLFKAEYQLNKDVINLNSNWVQKFIYFKFKNTQICIKQKNESKSFYNKTLCMLIEIFITFSKLNFIGNIIFEL